MPESPVTIPCLKCEKPFAARSVVCPFCGARREESTDRSQISNNGLSSNIETLDSSSKQTLNKAHYSLSQDLSNDENIDSGNLCPRCGIGTDMQKIYTESWEDRGYTLTGKHEFMVRSVSLPGYCSVCTKSIKKARIIAPILAALPLWLLGLFVGYYLDKAALFPLIALGIYSFYLIKNIFYSWTDLILYGAELETNLREKTIILKPDVAKVKFPVDIFQVILRLFFYFLTTFILVMLGAMIAANVETTRQTPSIKEVENPVRKLTDLSANDKFEYFVDIASKQGLEKAKELLSLNPEMKSEVDAEGHTLLMHAVKLNKPEIIFFLVKEEAIPLEAKDNNRGWTALHMAAADGRLASVNALLDLNADVNSPAKNGETPLIMAVSNEKATVCEALIEHGADLNVTLPSGASLLTFAKARYYTQVAAVLERHGAK